MLGTETLELLSLTTDLLTLSFSLSLSGLWISLSTMTPIFLRNQKLLSETRLLTSLLLEPWSDWSGMLTVTCSDQSLAGFLGRLWVLLFVQHERRTLCHSLNCSSVLTQGTPSSNLLTWHKGPTSGVICHKPVSFDKLTFWSGMELNSMTLMSKSLDLFFSSGKITDSDIPGKSHRQRVKIVNLKLSSRCFLKLKCVFKVFLYVLYL